MMTEDLSLFLTFAAGLLSFLSPCVLPLIPSYLGILGGQMSVSSRPRLVRVAAAFITGFSAVFITLGILVSATFSLMGGIAKYINRAAGIIVIVLGLNVIFDFLSFLNYEKRPFLRRGFSALGGIPAAFIDKRSESRDRACSGMTERAMSKQGVNTPRLAAESAVGAGCRARQLPSPAVLIPFIAGAAFAAGWTPCIGPVLTTILLMAGQSGKTGTAVFYLAVYSAGLGLPFLLAALFFDSFSKHTLRLRAHLLLIRRISGVILIIMGIMILSGQYSALNVLVQKQIFRYIDWAGARAFPFRLLARALEWLQNF